MEAVIPITNTRANIEKDQVANDMGNAVEQWLLTGNWEDVAETKNIQQNAQNTQQNSTQQNAQNIEQQGNNNANKNNNELNGNKKDEGQSIVDDVLASLGSLGGSSLNVVDDEYNIADLLNFTTKMNDNQNFTTKINDKQNFTTKMNNNLLNGNSGNGVDNGNGLMNLNLNVDNALIDGLGLNLDGSSNGGNNMSNIFMSGTSNNNNSNGSNSGTDRSGNNNSTGWKSWGEVAKEKKREADRKADPLGAITADLGISFDENGMMIFPDEIIHPAKKQKRNSIVIKNSQQNLTVEEKIANSSMRSPESDEASSSKPPLVRNSLKRSSTQSGDSMSTNSSMNNSMMSMNTSINSNTSSPILKNSLNDSGIDGVPLNTTILDNGPMNNFFMNNNMMFNDMGMSNNMMSHDMGTHDMGMNSMSMNNMGMDSMGNNMNQMGMNNMMPTMDGGGMNQMGMNNMMSIMDGGGMNQMGMNNMMPIMDGGGMNDMGENSIGIQHMRSPKGQWAQAHGLSGW